MLEVVDVHCQYLKVHHRTRAKFQTAFPIKMQLIIEARQ